MEDTFFCVSFKKVKGISFSCLSLMQCKKKPCLGLRHVLTIDEDW